MKTVRQLALSVLLECNAGRKATGALALSSEGDIGPDERLTEPHGVPGRPELPVLASHKALKQRSMVTVAGRAALIHALAHIELNAIEEALNVICGLRRKLSPQQTFPLVPVLNDDRVTADALDQLTEGARRQQLDPTDLRTAVAHLEQQQALDARVFSRASRIEYRNYVCLIHSNSPV